MPSRDQGLVLWAQTEQKGNFAYCVKCQPEVVKIMYKSMESRQGKQLGTAELSFSNMS